jgi:hypothetical protein
MSIGITSALSATAVAEESVAALGGLELAGVIDWRMRKEPNARPKPREGEQRDTGTTRGCVCLTPCLPAL